MVAFQFKSRRSILWCWFASSFFNALHFIVLGQATAGVLNLITTIRFLVAAHTTNKKFMYFFMALLLLGFVFTFKSPLNLLPLLATMAGTYGAFQSDDRRIRVVMVTCALTWIVHNTLAGSPVAVLMETSFLLSNLVGWWRFYSFRGEDRKR